MIVNGKKYYFFLLTIYLTRPSCGHMNRFLESTFVDPYLIYMRKNDLYFLSLSLTSLSDHSYFEKYESYSYPGVFM